MFIMILNLISDAVNAQGSAMSHATEAGSLFQQGLIPEAGAENMLAALDNLRYNSDNTAFSAAVKRGEMSVPHIREGLG